jgi:hypothetical protein
MPKPLLLALLCAAPILAEKPFTFWPGAAYDPRVPTLRQVLGYDLGDRITAPAGLIRYLNALAESSPRLKVFEYGQTWEGRKLVYAAVSSEANMKRLAEIRGAIHRLADPRQPSPEEARKLIAGLPVIVSLAYGVHGNEISSSDAALLTAYHLLAARNDEVAAQILQHAVLLVDPAQNPDGRARFLHTFEQSLGLEPDLSPSAAEHNEPWPGGRTNHYYFDLNRDWFAMTQPETRGRLKLFLEWYPLVSVDLHEMGTDSTYYFAPAADPYNPNLVREQRDGLAIFGRNNAKWFDRFGFDYFTREVYDAFYPGYGDSWPTYYGSIGMTYEQATVRGLLVRRSDETILRYRDTVRQHFVASISTAEAAAANREKLLDNFYRYRRSAAEEGAKDSIREYILPRGRDASTADKLAAMLVAQGAEVKRATAAFHAGDRECPAGTYVVPLAQPAKRLIRTLLDPLTPLDQKFIEQEEARRRRKARGEIYDVTAWSLPLAFNIEALPRPEVSTGSFENVTPDLVRPGRLNGDKAAVAWLVPWGSTAAGRLLAAALRQDLRILSSDKPFTLNRRKFPGGTLIFKVLDNPADLKDRLAALAASTGAEVIATDTSWVDDGVNFGSRYVVRLRKPVVALAWDTPTSAAAAGATRFVLERQFGYPVTAIRAAQLGAADLSRFQVLVLPNSTAPGGYSQAFGAAGIARLKQWVSAGGTLIGISGAVGFLCDPKVGLLAISQENAAKEKETAKKEEKKEEPSRIPGKLLANPADFAKAIEPDEELPDSVPGVLLTARINPDHWLTAGVAETVHPMFEGRAIYTPIKLDKGVNAAVYETADKLLASGYLWQENRRQLANKPLVVVQPEGRGAVIAFTADPNYRAFLDGMNVLFLNAVFRAPGHARPLMSEER